MILTHMDYVRGALAQAMAEGLSLEDVWEAADRASTPRAFDDNISAIIDANAAMGMLGKGQAWCSVTRQWVAIP